MHDAHPTHTLNTFPGERLAAAHALRDVAPLGVADGPAHRTRRARLMESLPGRRNAGLAVLPAANPAELVTRLETGAGDAPLVLEDFESWEIVRLARIAEREQSHRERTLRFAIVIAAALLTLGLLAAR